MKFCVRCEAPLDKPGGAILDVPNADGKSIQWDLCPRCTLEVLVFVAYVPVPNPTAAPRDA